MEKYAAAGTQIVSLLIGSTYLIKEDITHQNKLLHGQMILHI